MPRNRYGYDVYRYRGRSGVRGVLIGIIVVLVILLILAVCAFFMLQKYMVYTDDGRAYLEVPFFQKASEEPAPTLAPQVSQDIVVVTAPPDATPAATTVPAPERQTVTNAVWLLRGHLLGGDWKGEMEKAGANAVLFNLKADDGTLGYVSDSGEALRLKAAATDRKLNDSLTAVTATDQYVIARLSCFQDNLAPKNDNALAIRTNSGYNWRDAADTRWMNVAVPAARAYVVGIIKEIAALGVDEILLENSGYPTTGNLDYIKTGEAYDPKNLTVSVEAFYREVQEALSGTGVKLSIATSEDVILGRDDKSGQTLALLAKYADRVYVPQSAATEYTQLLESWAAMPDAETIPSDRLVWMVPKETAVDSAVSHLILR